MVPDKKPITILIIDDDEIVCYMAKTILEDNLRCEVLTAFSGMDGIDMMIENKVHLVLLDVAMSGWSGFNPSLQSEGPGSGQGLPGSASAPAA